MNTLNIFRRKIRIMMQKIVLKFLVLESDARGQKLRRKRRTEQAMTRKWKNLLLKLLLHVSNLFLYKKNFFIFEFIFLIYKLFSDMLSISSFIDISQQRVVITFSYKFYEITCTIFICHCIRQYTSMVINYEHDLISDGYKSQDCRYLCIVLTINDNNNTKLSFNLTFPLYS